MEPLSGNYSFFLQRRRSILGLNTNRNAANIIVYHRYRQVLEQEIISPVVMLAMRNMYQSTFGYVMKSAGEFASLSSGCTLHSSHADHASFECEVQGIVKADVRLPAHNCRQRRLI
jgi:hypothetical protein